YALWIQMTKGHAAEEAEARVLAAVADVAARPVVGVELRAAQARVETAFWRELSSSHGRSERLGEFEIATGDFRRAFARADELALRGAGGKTREELDAALDALGATLEVDTQPDETRFEGDVLARNLDAYLALAADVLLRPTFAPAELARTKRELIAQIEEQR